MRAALPELHPLFSAWVIAFAAVPMGLTLFDAMYAHHAGIPLSAAAGNRWTTVISYLFLLGWIAQWMFPH